MSEVKKIATRESYGKALVELLEGKPLKMNLCGQEQTLSDSISHAL